MIFKGSSFPRRRESRIAENQTWLTRLLDSRLRGNDGSWLVGFFLSFLAFPALANSVSLEGDFVQGGLVLGLTAPGSKATFNGKAVRVSGEGLFILGFGRDAKNTATLEVTFPDGIKESRSLKIKPRQFKIQRIDGLPKRKVTPNPKDVARIVEDNKGIGRVRRLDSDIAYFTSGFQWPARGRISGVFGSQRILNGQPRSPHNGVDVATPTGTQIVAPADGLVALVHQDMFYTGKTMMIDHGHGLSTVYAHMSKISVTDGQKVKKGEKIGEIGATGRATGPHLHWGMSLFSTHLDPALVAGEMD